MSGINKNEIDRWLREGLITAEQAKKMLEDAFKTKEQHSSNYAITIISIIGSVLIGLGAILVVKSNWGLIPDVIKIGTLLVSTIAAYAAGYYCKYRRKALPIVGSALVFLGSLLFGSTVFVIGKIYHLSLWYDFKLYSIWLLGSIIALYVFSSVPIAALAALIFFRVLYLLPDVIAPKTYLIDLNMEHRGVLSMIVGALFLYTLGTFHYCWERFKKIGFVYKVAGLGMLFFAVSVIFVASARFHGLKIGDLRLDSFVILLLGAIIPSIGLALYTYYRNPEEKEIHLLELVYTAVLSGVVFLMAYVPLGGWVYELIISFVFTQIVFLQMFYNYIKRNAGLLALLVVSLCEFIFIFCRSLSSTGYVRETYFLMSAGAILVMTGFMLERKRREGKTFSPEELQNIKRVFFVSWLALFVVLALFILMKQPNVGGVIAFRF